SLQRLPELPELHQLLAQAMEKRGKQLQLTWRDPNSQIQFTLEVLCRHSGGEPKWTLYSANKGQRQVLFDYNCIDVLLVYNLMCSTCSGNVSKAVQIQTQNRLSAIQPTTAQFPELPKPTPWDKKASEQEAPPSTETPPPPPPHSAPTPQSAPPPPPKPTVPTSGSLADLSISDLLIKITASDVTGKLEVQNPQTTAVVYVQDGALVDATVSDAVGDDAIIELLTWKEGQFTFEMRTLRNRNTVRQDIKSLLAQSEQFARHTKILKDRGMRITSILVPRDPNLTQEDFVERVSSDCPVDLQMIAEFYLSLDGEKTVEQLQRDLPISRIQMIHMIHHLVIHGVVDISNEAARQETLSLAVKPIDTAAIQAVMMSLRRVDTGMFLYPAFLYFLEQEYFRSYRSRSPFSVIVFEMRVASNVDGKVVRRVLPTPAIVDAALRINQLKRHQDLLAHYDAYDYALLLPNTKSAGARIFGNRVLKTLTDRPLAETNPHELSLAFGCASVPEDFVDLSSLLAGADLAMSQSRAKGQPLVLYQDIKHLVR
ncbi:MAG TPA: DUF4388 domain-containing protein, partial [Candidatus Obscuribacterales bacterium]